MRGRFLLNGAGPVASQQLFGLTNIRLHRKTVASATRAVLISPRLR